MPAERDHSPFATLKRTVADKTYATLGGVVVLLVWIWITNVAILLGHELNAERERSAEIAEGVPRAEKEIQLEPREEPDTDEEP